VLIDSQELEVTRVAWGPFCPISLSNSTF
jgi:hypothetical protein